MCSIWYLKVMSHWDASLKHPEHIQCILIGNIERKIILWAIYNLLSSSF